MKKDDKNKDFSNECCTNEHEQNALKKGLRDYRRSNPEFAKSFIDLWIKSKEGTTIPRIYKELTELAITIVQRCKPCIFLHTKLCIESGATKEQIIEATQIGVVMGGAPSYQYLGYVMEAIEIYKDKFSNKKEEEG